GATLEPRGRSSPLAQAHRHWAALPHSYVHTRNADRPTCRLGLNALPIPCHREDRPYALRCHKRPPPNLSRAVGPMGSFAHSQERRFPEPRMPAQAETVVVQNVAACRKTSPKTRDCRREWLPERDFRSAALKGPKIEMGYTGQSL